MKVVHHPVLGQPVLILSLVLISCLGPFLLPLLLFLCEQLVKPSALWKTYFSFSNGCCFPQSLLHVSFTLLIQRSVRQVILNVYICKSCVVL